MLDLVSHCGEVNASAGTDFDASRSDDEGARWTVVIASRC
jgi:hypothetical protein